MIINEGMRGGDLEDLVLPMMSVDEFVSKVSDDAMVFGFFVSDKDAANDLNRFIQKSPIKLLDTEVSPAPDQRGFYVLFFEVMRSERLPSIVASVLEEIEPLVKIEKWKMQIRDKEDLVEFSEKTLAEYAKEVTDQIKKKEKRSEKTVDESILEYLRPSCLTGAKARQKNLTLEGFGYKTSYEVVAFGDAAMVSSTLGDSPLDISLHDAAKESRVEKMLGEGWTVLRVGGLTHIQHIDSDEALLLRDR